MSKAVKIVLILSLILLPMAIGYLINRNYFSKKPMECQIKHLAIIMDGNRRWAKIHKKISVLGHKEGVSGAKKAIEFCLKNKISYLTLYVWSLENFNRSQDEQDYIFKMMSDEILAGIDKFVKNGVKVQFVGDRTLFPAQVIDACSKIEEATKGCDKLTVFALFCYSGRQEIVEAAKKFANDVKNGKAVDSINTENFKNYLWTGNTPDPDLILRTGSHKRLSNCLLYQCAYSELYFVDKFWPEITEADLESAVSYFNSCKRNFGA